MRNRKSLQLIVPLIVVMLRTGITPLAAESRYDGPLFDAHSHLTPAGDVQSGGSGEPGRGPRGRGGRRGGRSLPNAVELLESKGLTGVFLFGSRSTTAEERARRPAFVHPYAEIGRDASTGKLDLTEETPRSLERQLSSTRLYGIGEIPLRHSPTKRNPGGDAYPADDTVVLRICDLAARYGIPVNVHVEYEYSAELERALAYNRKAVIIWAHMGDAPAALVGDLMRHHPNLYADISCRNPYYERNRGLDEQSLTDEAGRLKEEWRTLFEEFPDRFLFGLDLGAPPRFRTLDDVLSYSRSVLGQLTPSTAEKIAWRNAIKYVRR